LPEWRHYTSISSREHAPDEFALTVYPNPGNAQVNIQFSLPQSVRVKIDIFNALGQQLRSRNMGMLQPGNYVYRIDNSDLATGVY